MHGSLFGRQANDLLEHLLSFAEGFEEYELDELIFASFSAFPLLLWFAVRRTREIRHELSASKSLYANLKIGISHDPTAPFPLATLEDAGMAVAVDGRILRINQSAVELFGYSAVEATGRRVTDIIYVKGAEKEAKEDLVSNGRGPSDPSLNDET